MIYVKISLKDYGTYIQTVGDANVILTEIENAIENEELDAVWTVSFIEMPEKEYEALDEFAGH